MRALRCRIEFAPIRMVAGPFSAQAPIRGPIIPPLRPCDGVRALDGQRCATVKRPPTIMDHFDVGRPRLSRSRPGMCILGVDPETSTGIPTAHDGGFLVAACRDPILSLQVVGEV